MIMKKKVVKTTPQTPKKENTSFTTKTPTTPDRVIRPYVNKHEGDTMKGLFFIVKGQYRKSVAPSFVNDATGEVSYVGGYDPSSSDTENWYMCIDKVTYHCTSCGSDLNKVLKSVYNMIMKYKGSAKKYFKYVSDTTSDDYYETHYLGHPELTPDRRAKKAEGRCPRTSPAMRCLHNAVYEYYGDFFSDQVQEMEDQAYSDLEEVIRESKLINKTKKRLSKVNIQKPVMDTPTKSEVQTTSKVVKPKVKLGVKKLAIR